MPTTRYETGCLVRMAVKATLAVMKIVSERQAWLSVLAELSLVKLSSRKDKGR